MLSPHHRTSAHNLSIFIPIWCTLRLRRYMQLTMIKHTALQSVMHPLNETIKIINIFHIFGGAIMASVSPMPVALTRISM